jgi:hypothetical protein
MSMFMMGMKSRLALDVLVLEPHLGHLDPFGRIVIRVVERSL